MRVETAALALYYFAANREDIANSGRANIRWSNGKVLLNPDRSTFK